MSKYHELRKITFQVQQKWKPTSGGPESLPEPTVFYLFIAGPCIQNGTTIVDDVDKEAMSIYTPALASVNEQ